MLAKRAVYWAAEDAANTLDATAEQIEAWETAMAAFHVVVDEVNALRGAL